MQVGIDIGGTFTDLVAVGPDGVRVVKVSSTPADPAQAFARALEALGAQPDEVRHGTTVATNAVLTRTGARSAFVATVGFEHLLHLARQDRPRLYDLEPHRPEPLIALEDCVGVRERVGPDGEVMEELDERALRKALRKVRGVDGVAITLLHSYANPGHERRVAQIVADELGIDVSASVDVLPEIREYERASTTALNAYVQPALRRYLGRIRDESSGPRVGVMWSGGGVRGIDSTIDRPVHTLLSGPAAGVLAAAWIGERCGVRDLVTIDMGGTSADVAIVDDGRPLVATESSLDGLPFRTPCLDVISVGAGGGSIAWMDEGGALRVGPSSAGADPGPACYGRGGTDATVSDAQAVLGYLSDDLAGGELTLDVDAAGRAVDALAVGLSRDEAAAGILRVVRATMARAIRSVSIERGKDVRDYALVAFGGAGPLHATALARDLGMRRVLIPPAPGALAALGLLVASRRADASLSRPMAADRARDDQLRATLAELTARALEDLTADGVTPADATTGCGVDLRYAGQSHEITVPVDSGPSFALLTEAFHRAHAERFGFARDGVSVEAVTFRAWALGPRGTVETTAGSGSAPEPVGLRTIEGAEAPVHTRPTLPAGHILHGPAVIVEDDSTTWLDADATAEVHPSGALLVEVT